MGELRGAFHGVTASRFRRKPAMLSRRISTVMSCWPAGAVTSKPGALAPPACVTRSLRAWTPPPDWRRRRIAARVDWQQNITTGNVLGDAITTAGGHPRGTRGRCRAVFERRRQYRRRTHWRHGDGGNRRRRDRVWRGGRRDSRAHGRRRHPRRPPKRSDGTRFRRGSHFPGRSRSAPACCDGHRHDHRMVSVVFWGIARARIRPAAPRLPPTVCGTSPGRRISRPAKVTSSSICRGKSP